MRPEPAEFTVTWSIHQRTRTRRRYLEDPYDAAPLLGCRDVRTTSELPETID
jgi:hypothetical protein